MNSLRRVTVSRGASLVRLPVGRAAFFGANQFIGNTITSNGPAGVRLFHISQISLAKAKKGGSKKGGDDSDDGVEVKLPDLVSIKKNMEGVIDRFGKELVKLKVGKASADMFSDIQVGSYGSVASAGQVTVKSATTISIAVYDPSMVKTVADAVRDCGMGFTPTIENSTVSVFVAKPSKESRDTLVKAAGKIAEKGKLDVRNHRKSALDEMKKLKGSVSEDESKRFSKDVETITEKSLDGISKLLAAKEKEIQSA